MSNTILSSLDLDPIVKLALEEDLVHGDVTTNALVSSDSITNATIVAREPLTLAGIPLLQKIFELLDSSVTLQVHRIDGETIQVGETIASLRGSTRSILKGERTALNFLQHLSGIATITKTFCDAVRKYPTKILDTRKTIPGLRRLEKWAVAIGSGTNHRMSLNDGILIKDNHIATLRSQGMDITKICRLAKAKGPHGLKIFVEIESLDEIEQAIEGQAAVLLLDNMSPELVRQAVNQIKGRAIVEVSGGITLDNVLEFAAAGADYISIGSLTHSAPAVNMSLEI